MYISNQNDKKTHIPKLEFGQGIRVAPPLWVPQLGCVLWASSWRASTVSNAVWDIISVMTPKEADTILESGAVYNPRSNLRAVTRPNSAYFTISDGHRALRDTAAGYFGL